MRLKNQKMKKMKKMKKKKKTKKSKTIKLSKHQFISLKTSLNKQIRKLLQRT